MANIGHGRLLAESFVAYGDDAGGGNGRYKANAEDTKETEEGVSQSYDLPREAGILIRRNVPSQMPSNPRFSPSMI